MIDPSIATITTNSRKPELDVLRGVAIILVLFAHSAVAPFLTTMGWIGVDLFFVLSGFLISGLLFSEYKKTGGFNATRFLIRRGFKIYPLYYLFIVIYSIPFLVKGTLSLIPILGDLAFLQNYVSGFGYTFGPSWSLAVEEHFYIMLAIAFYIATKNTTSLLLKKIQSFLKRNVVSIFIGIMVAVLAARIVSNILSSDIPRLVTMTHLRIDALLAGVLIGYGYYYHREKITRWISSKKKFLLLLALAALAFTPFISLDSPFVRTFGFSLTWIGFGLILLVVIYTEHSYKKICSFLSKPAASALATIGTYSYAIYVVHALINTILRKAGLANPYLYFIIGSTVSIFLGWILTEFVEKKFLELREKWYPKR